MNYTMLNVNALQVFDVQMTYKINKRLLILFWLLFITNNTFATINIGYGVIVENDSGQNITIGIETGSKLIEVKAKESKFIHSQSGPRELFWTVKIGNSENMYKTFNKDSKDGKYINPHIITISNYGKSYIMTEKKGLGKAVKHDIVDAINMKKIKETIIAKDPKTNYTEKLSPDIDTKLWLLICKKDDDNTTALIKHFNISPNYKLFKNNIIVSVVNNKMIKTLKELLNRDADINIIDLDGKKLIDIAQNTDNKEILFLLQQQQTKKGKQAPGQSATQAQKK